MKLTGEFGQSEPIQSQGVYQGNFQQAPSQGFGEIGLTQVVPVFGTKRDVAKMLKVSLRTVDNYLADGCPVIKPSPRCCRFDLLEFFRWYKGKYGQQTRKSFATN